MSDRGRKVKGWEGSSKAVLPCKWCQGMGLFRTSDIMAACLKCHTCRQCGRDRLDPCADCQAWDRENRGADGKVKIHGIRERRAVGE